MSFSSRRTRNFIRKITPGEFEYQATDYTQVEIEKLTQTTKYQRMLAAKGKNMIQWNWNAKEAQEGHVVDYSVVEGNVDLNREFDKIDKELSRNRHTQVTSAEK